MSSAVIYTRAAHKHNNGQPLCEKWELKEATCVSDFLPPIYNIAQSESRIINAFQLQEIRKYYDFF